METIVTNPGLQHLVEEIFLNLDTRYLKICVLINQFSKQTLENPLFWLKKFRKLSKENQKDWIKVFNTASHKKGTTSRVANSEFQIFCYWVMGPYEETPMTPKILVPAALGGPNGPFLVPK